ncbi:MAG: hypothetical protein U9Q76_09745 [candidate division WOR-3 bacterium]|nr:hypothetical protein [candidate division WOR-3 bacterium]
MSAGKRKCPKCGSRRFIEVDADRLMCKRCYVVYQRPAPPSIADYFNDEERPPCPICGNKNKERKTRKCPYCMRSGICAEHFEEGICSECKQRYQQIAAVSEYKARKKQISRDTVYDLIETSLMTPRWYFWSTVLQEATQEQEKKDPVKWRKNMNRVYVTLALVAAAFFAIPLIVVLILVLINLLK